MKTKKNQIWNFNNEIDAEVCGEGVKRKILAYADEMMCVENHLKKVPSVHCIITRTPRSPMWCPVSLNLQSTEKRRS